MSKIIESLRDDLAALHEAGAISKVTMCEFDVICPPPAREFISEIFLETADGQHDGDAEDCHAGQ